MISGLNEQLQQELEYTLRIPYCHSWGISKIQSERENTLEERYAIRFCLKLGKNATETNEMLQTAFEASCMNLVSVFEWHERFKWGIMRGVGGVRESIHQSWLAKGLGLGLVCSGFKGVQEEIRSEEASISTRTMHQSTTPYLSQTIWRRWASRQFFSLPIVQALLPVTFGYSLSSEAVVMRQLKRWKTLWRRSLTRSHMGPSRSSFNSKTSALQPEEITSKGNRVLPWGFPELVGMVQQVH